MDIASQHATVKQHILAESAMGIEIVRRSLSPYAFSYFYYIDNRLSITTILL